VKLKPPQRIRQRLKFVAHACPRVRNKNHPASNSAKSARGGDQLIVKAFMAHLYVQGVRQVFELNEKVRFVQTEPLE
jgi:hypothetical protein